MKTKPVHKKGKKRSLKELSLPSKKPDQKSENVVQTKSKKAKIDNTIQNGDSVPKAKVFQKINKQKTKQKKVKEQNDDNIKKSSKVKVRKNIAEEAEPIVAEAKKNTHNVAKEKKLEHLKNKQLIREMNKTITKKTNRYIIPPGRPLDLELMKSKVAEIRSRDVLSKTAKKRLSVLSRKIRAAEEAKSKESEAEEKNKKNKQQADMSTKNKQTVNIKDKRKAKEEHGKKKKAKKNNEIAKDDNNKDQCNIKEEEEEMDIMQGEIDAGSVEDEDNKEEETATIEVKKEKKKVNQSADVPKKKEMEEKQCVLYVGNLPSNITNKELKKHFLSKVDAVTSINIQTKSDTKKSHSFAYVELPNSAACEKALSLNHTFLKKNRIHVQYKEASKNTGKIARNTLQQNVAKNKKLEVLRKTAKLADVKEKKKLKKGKQKSKGVKA